MTTLRAKASHPILGLGQNSQGCSGATPEYNKVGKPNLHINMHEASLLWRMYEDDNIMFLLGNP